MDDFQEMVVAAQDLRDECKEYGIRLSVNGDGTVSLFHGTSTENAEMIMNSGFSAGTYFSHAKTVTGYGDEGPSWFANVKNQNGCVLEVRVDARCVEFVSSTGEFYCPNAIKLDKESGLWRDAEGLFLDNSFDVLIEEAVDRSNETISRCRSMNDKECELCQ